MNLKQFETNIENLKEISPDIYTDTMLLSIPFYMLHKKLFDEGEIVYGPYSADGFFGSANIKNFDGILSMYHDQGLTGFKSISFDEGVNFTAGLPIVRTSPDHGTAFDITGKGIASERSFRNAYHLACDVYKTRQMQKEITDNPLKVKKQDKDRR